MSSPNLAADAGFPGVAALDAARAFLSRCGPNRRILVAVSGGSDSMGLLFALYSAAAEMRGGVEIFAATVDHGLRPESALEAEAVAAYCRTLAVEHAILRWEDEKPQSGLMAAARLARYRLLQKAARRFACDFVVTAHTFGDQMETAAMRSARSEEGRGMAGMAEAVLFAGETWVLRPFLDIHREAIRDMLRVHHVGWVEDPSNRNVAFERVRVRQLIVSSDFSGQVEAAAAKRIVDARAAADVLSGTAASPLPGYFTFPVESCGRAGGWLALKTLIAVAGGQAFLPADDKVEALRTAIFEGADFRKTLSRSVVERRGATLHICREHRNLPEQDLAPGKRAVWDSRFLVKNRSGGNVKLSGGAEDISVKEAPPRVAARIRQTSLAFNGVKFSDLQVQPYLSPFELFLPMFDYPLACAVAKLAGRPDFPSPIVEVGPKR